MNERTNNNSALLKHRITFLKPPGSIEDGWPIQDWKDHITVWAEIKTLKGKRVVDAAAVQLQDVKTFGIRYRKDVNDKMRIRHNGKNYRIVSMTNDDENNQWYTILTQEVL